jgi:peptidoglycan biosynthesis protein MviN/MurJ (putative lipid II flippase)
MLALLAKVALASTVLLAICWAGAHLLLADWALQPFWPKCASLVVVIGVGAAGFFLCANALGITEVHEIAGAVRRRLRRAGS